jgi:hypothetical protein
MRDIGPKDLLRAAYERARNEQRREDYHAALCRRAQEMRAQMEAETRAYREELAELERHVWAAGMVP